MDIDYLVFIVFNILQQISSLLQNGAVSKTKNSQDKSLHAVFPNYGKNTFVGNGLDRSGIQVLIQSRLSFLFKLREVFDSSYHLACV